MDLNSIDLKHLPERDRYRLNQYMNSKSICMKEVISELVLFAPSDLSVVVEGESGTGKEMFVLALHALSRQFSGPFVPVNMGEGPDTLFESALFGHRKGAFTGADQTRSGYLEQANGGTLFLDEINSLNKNLQPKLLRVLETRTYRPIGASRMENTTARFVFSSNEPLEQMTYEGRFRCDLFYRMGRVIRLPPLRERKEDLPSLVDNLLLNLGKYINPTLTTMNGDLLCQKNRSWSSDNKIPKVTTGAMERIQAYSWPGNIRQLKQILERAFLLSEDGTIFPEHLSLPYEESKFQDFGKATEEFEETYFNQVFAIAGGSVQKGIKLTGMSETSYRRKLRKYGKSRIKYFNL